LKRKSRSIAYLWVSYVLLNLCIISLVAFAIWVTHSLWAFGGLFFLLGVRSPFLRTKCPKCDYEFVAIQKEDDDD